MKSLKLIILAFFLFTNHLAKAQASLVTLANSMTKEDVWTALLSINAKGETIFGKCRIQNAVSPNCPNCACNYYFKGNRLGSLGMTGWGKNPNSGDGTGCFVWKSGAVACWPGQMAGTMCTSDMKANAKAILLDALSQNPADVCGLPVPATNTGGVSITDSSKFLFVDPSESCAKGKVLCGSVSIGSEVAGMSQFTRFPEKFCNAAFGAAKKSTSNKAKMINCSQYNSNVISTSLIMQAASMVGQMNAGYDIFHQAGIEEFLSYDQAQLQNMTFQQVALYYVAVGKNINKMPKKLVDDGRIQPNKFDTARQNNGDKWIVTSEITAAEAQLASISQGVIAPKNLTIDQAVQILQNQQLTTK